MKLNPSDLNGRLLLVQVHLLKVNVFVVVVAAQIKRFSFDCQK